MTSLLGGKVTSFWDTEALLHFIYLEYEGAHLCAGVHVFQSLWSSENSSWESFSSASLWDPETSSGFQASPSTHYSQTQKQLKKKKISDMQICIS